MGTALARATTYVRDPTSQRVTSTTDPLNRQTESAYDSVGNLTSVTRVAGTGPAVTTSWTYEPLFQQVATVTDPLGHTTSFTYDAAGQLTAVTNPLTQQWTVALTMDGQVASVIDPLTHGVQYEYAFGDLTAVTNALGHRARSTPTGPAGASRPPIRSATGRRSPTRRLNLVDRVTDAIGGETSFTYDGNGNVLTLTDARGGVTTYTYDTMDRVATRTDPVNHAESYAYDANGKLEEVTDRKGQVTTYTSDALDRLATITYADSSTTTYPANAVDATGLRAAIQIPGCSRGRKDPPAWLRIWCRYCEWCVDYWTPPPHTQSFFPGPFSHTSVPCPSQQQSLAV